MKRLTAGERGLQRSAAPEIIDAKVQPVEGQKSGGVMSVLRRVADAAKTVFSGSASVQSRNDSRLEPYPGISAAFEPNIERIIQARTNRDGTIDVSETHSLAQDIAVLLVRIVKQFTDAKRRENPTIDVKRARTELMLALKTIVLERARAVFDDDARRNFSRQLDRAILTKGAMEGEY